MEQRTKYFATHCHQGQMRKYTGKPYISHPAAVVELVRSVSHDENMLCAAWLHDVVEDTSTTLMQIYERFGEDISDLVEMLTDVSKPTDGNRKIRKAIDLVHISVASPRAKTIKLADLIDNTSSIMEHDPEFAVVYLEEKKALLSVLREGDRTLWKLANEIVTKENK